MSNDERDKKICTAYTEGETISALAGKFKVSGQRVRQILRAGGVWKKAAARDVFLGVDVTQATKEKLKKKADKEQKSMSKVASDAIEKVLEGDVK